MRKTLFLTTLVALSVLHAEHVQLPLDGQRLETNLMASARIPKQKLHPKKHFEDFSEISFKEDLGGSAKTIVQSRQKSPAEVGRHRAGNVIADASKEIANQIDVQGVKVHTAPVTNAEYYEFIQATGHTPPKHWSGGAFSKGQEKKPVTNINFMDAQAYAKWANKRLPTQTEWNAVMRQLDSSLETPASEWTATMSDLDVPNAKQIILNQDGSSSSLNPLESNLQTGFRVVTPEGSDLPKPQADPFMLPDGNIIRPDQSLMTPEKQIIEESGNPYDYGN